MLFDLFNPLKNRYPAAQGNKDQERVQQIRQNYGKLKNVKDFVKEIYVPSFMQKQHCLFYGRFECGNLNRVVQRNMGSSSMEYDLYLQQDTNSEGLMHWYFFKVITKGLEVGTRVKLNIRNLHRSRSLYEHGMLPRICYEDTLLPGRSTGNGGDTSHPFASVLPQDKPGESPGDDEDASASVASGTAPMSASSTQPR